VARRRRCRRKARFSAAEVAHVARLIRRKWSAEQIAGVLKKRALMSISHGTIYRRIRWDRRVSGNLWRHIRIMSKLRHKRYRTTDSRGVLPGKRAITERPPEIERRQEIGHWEGDTVMGGDMRHGLRTLVERKTGYAIIKELSARNKDQVIQAATRAIRGHCHSFKTLTLDNGTEFHDYAVLEQRFPLTVYFAIPYHAWEHGSNGNFNGLVRQYPPKGLCMKKITQAQCDRIPDDLNHRPRRRHGFDTPAALYERH
jgi:IS30 family transposase